MTYPMHWHVEMQISWLKPESENLHLPLDFWTVYNFPAGSWPALFGWLHMRKVQERNETNLLVKFSVTRTQDKSNEENNVENGWQ